MCPGGGMNRSSLSNKMRALALVAAVFGFAVPGSAPVAAANSLATPITGREVQELWPIEIRVEMVKVIRPGERYRKSVDGQPTATVPLPSQTVVVPDGHQLRFSSVVQTAKGQRRFELQLVARHHPEAVELEYDLEVSEASYRKIGVGDYLLHRLRLGPQMQLEEEGLKIARSDIVSTRDQSFASRIAVDGDVYEIHVFAKTTRG